MYVVVVDFRVQPEAAEAFREAVLKQAENSLTHEPECKVFDVASPGDDPARFFLYELYDDEAAFQEHLSSAHFVAFDAQVAPMTVSKSVETLTLVSPERSSQT